MQWKIVVLLDRSIVILFHTSNPVRYAMTLLDALSTNEKARTATQKLFWCFHAGQVRIRIVQTFVTAKLTKKFVHTWGNSVLQGEHALECTHTY